MLTDRQKFALLWLRDNHQSDLAWTRNGKAAYGSPDKWDAMKISGKQGSIIIPTPDWEAIRPYICVAHHETGRAYIPNEAGAEILAA